MRGEKRVEESEKIVHGSVQDKIEEIKSNQKSLIDSSSCYKPEAKLWFRGIRPSKFRHVYCHSKKECYTDISIHRNGHDGNVCAVNPIFLAIEADAAFIVIPLNHTGRIDFQRCKVIGHCGQIFDLKWNPFDDFQIASASEDSTIKLWNIPEMGLTSTLSDFSLELLGHRRKVTQLEWHPSTKNVLISTSFDNLVIIWDVSSTPLNGNHILKVIDCHVDQIYSLAINREGSHIATTSKDKMLRLIEPRTGIVVSQGIAHNGTKQSRVVFLHNDKILTTGFSKRSDRQYAIWNQHDLTKALVTGEIDSSSGILNPFYDYETKTLYLCGKGEGCIRYYEIVEEDPYIYYLNQFVSGQPQKALGWMPKRGLNVDVCEIFRFYKLHASGNIVEPVSFIVPRKSTFFQADLYPDTLSTKPAMTIEQWFVLGMNIKPILMSMKTNDSLVESIMREPTKTQQPVPYFKKDQNELQSRLEFKSIGVLRSSSEIIENNISRKFAFLAHETVPDYRTATEKFINKNEKTNTNQSTKIHQMQSAFKGNVENGTLSKNITTLEENINLIHAENELKKIVQTQQDEIKNLRNQLKTSDKRIRELEFEVKRLRLEKN